MAKYLVEIDGTIELEADDEMYAEDLALEIIHSERPETDAVVSFNIYDVKEIKE